MADNGRLTWINDKRLLSDLIPWPRNPRQVKVEQVKRLQESLTEFGQPETIAIGPGNELYNGHQRLKSWADKFGDIEVDVRVADRALTEKEREKLTIFLHKGAAGEWDFDTLANEFDVDDLLDWGFDDHELDLDLWGVEPEEDPGAQIDRAEELREKWGVETGQLWRLGEHRLICGDATEVITVDTLLQGKKVELVTADPPYGIGLLSERGRVGLSREYEPTVGDEDTQTAKALFEIWRREGELQVWWGANHYGDVLPSTSCWLVWDKDHHGMTYADAELAWTNLDSPVRVFRHAWSGADRDSEKGEERLHPNQKPVALFEWYLSMFTDKDDLVADPCVGVGGGLIACERLGRKCRAVEISPAYCAVAIQRWVDMTGGEPELVSE